MPKQTDGVTHSRPFFYVLLTVHLSITLVNDQLDAQIFNTFITILYIFRAISCSSSGGQIVLIQHLVSSLSVSDRPVHRCLKFNTFFVTDLTVCIVVPVSMYVVCQEFLRNNSCPAIYQRVKRKRVCCSPFATIDT
jgi:hypothetical protein